MPDFRPPNAVVKIPLPSGGSGEQILEALQTLRHAVEVQETSSTSDGFFGWMMQAASDGTFDHAVMIFERGIKMLDPKFAEP